MKFKIALMVTLAVAIVAIGCSLLKMGKNVGPLAKIVAYVGEVPLGESGRSATATEISIGGSVIFTVQGRDVNGNAIAVEPTWTASKQGIVEIVPVAGSRVVVKGLKEGTIDIFVEFGDVKYTIELVSVR